MRWRAVAFHDAIRDCSSGHHKVLQSNYLTCGLLPVVDQGANTPAGYVSDESLAYDGELPVIIFGDHTRQVKYVDFRFAIGADGVRVLRPTALFDPVFLYHYIRYLDIPSAGYSRHLKFLKKALFIAPPLGEQRRIANALDQVDSLREKRRKAIALLDDLAQSVFLDIFGDPEMNPESLPVRSLKDVVDTNDRINYGVVQPGGDAPGGVPLVRVGDIVSGRVDHFKIKRISPDVEASYKRSRIKGIEVLVACVGSIGAIAIATEAERGFNIARAVSRVPASVSGQ